MKKKISCSLCISTYNWPDALELCLLSVLEQTIKPDEIIIGDDGSKETTKTLIDKIRPGFSVPVVHIWQPDEGFKLAEIRNKCFAAATNDYIIEVDGDVLLNKFFIEDHLRFAKEKTFVAGSRSLITEKVTRQILVSKSVKHLHQSKLKKRYNSIRFLPASFLIYNIQHGISQAQHVQGANMAFWKKDLIKVNGYNEDYKGWGKEDNDISIRLCNAGVKLHFIKFAAIIYHVYHSGAEKNTISNNELLLMKATQEKQTYVQNGMSKYL